jgi:hypothetical protein
MRHGVPSVPDSLIDLRNPAWYRSAIAIIFFPKLLSQRRFLVEEDEQVECHYHEREISRERKRVEQPGLSTHDEPDADIQLDCARTGAVLARREFS